MQTNSFSSVFNHFSENKRLLTFSLIVGIAAALGVRLFYLGISFFQTYFREFLLNKLSPYFGVWAIIPILAVAGFIVSYLAMHLIGEERHHGVAGIIESTALKGGKLPYEKVPFKALLSAFSLGAGASVGPEDPSVQLGANIGSVLGQALQLSESRINLLIASGAAAGIAAAFSAPIAGVFFALEAILGDFSSQSFGVVVLASVVSAVTTRFLTSDTPSLGIQTYSLGGLSEIPFYIILGVICAPVAALFIKMLYWQHDFWHHFKVWKPLKGALAGAVVGGFAVYFPQIMGTGHETLEQMLSPHFISFGIAFLIALALVKLVATTISLGGGFIGGMFAPSLFVGAAIGAAFGQALPLLTHGAISANPAVFAMAGMAAMMTGVIRAPITSVLLLFELTDDYRLILPIMLITAVTLFIVEKMAPMGIYEHGLARKGVNILKGKSTDLLDVVKVGEVMQKEFSSIKADFPVAKLAQLFSRSHEHSSVVIDQKDHLVGIVSVSDLERAKKRTHTKNTPVIDIATKKVLSISKNASIADALRLMHKHQVSHLPVLDPQQKNTVIGVLNHRDVVRAYEIAQTRKHASAKREKQLRLELART